MKRFLRNFLGLTEIENRLNRIAAAYDTLQRYNTIEHRTTQQALGRIIAKLDPMYGTSEFDPARRAASDKLAEETIKRLEAEDWARRHSTWELP